MGCGAGGGIALTSACAEAQKRNCQCARTSSNGSGAITAAYCQPWQGRRRSQSRGAPYLGRHSVQVDENCCIFFGLGEAEPARFGGPVRRLGLDGCRTEAPKLTVVHRVWGRAAVVSWDGGRREQLN